MGFQYKPVVIVLGIMTILYAIWWLLGYYRGLGIELKSKPYTKYRKKSDMTKLTQFHFDYIMFVRNEWVIQNTGKSRDDRVSVEKLTSVINGNLMMDKSTRALSRVWTGEIKREDLPVGKKLFDY